MARAFARLSCRSDRAIGAAILGRLFATLVVIASRVTPAAAQVFDRIDLEHLNRSLRGRLVDRTQDHGHDRRNFSPILGRPRDLYVYLPPGYDPSIAYPLIASSTARASTSTTSSTPAS